MSNPIFISYAHEDRGVANFFADRLQSAGYSVFLDTRSLRGGAKFEAEIKDTMKSALAVVTLVSPDSKRSDWVMRECTWAKQYKRLLIPVLIRLSPDLPWYLDNIHVIDGTVDFDAALNEVLASLPNAVSGMTFGEARAAYLQRATLKSRHTMDAYDRAITLFFDFLEDRGSPSRALPIQNRQFTVAEEIPLSALIADDAPILLQFAQWQLASNSGKPGDKRPYKPSTVNLRVSGVQNWLQYLDDFNWLPPGFPLAKARRIVRDELSARPGRGGPPQPPDHMEEVIYYYDTLELPKRLRKPTVSEDRIRQWELTRLRNRALLHCLAETGGRVSEVLSLNLNAFPVRNLQQKEVLRVEVMGKGGHPYYLRFFDSLPVIREYIHARGADLRASSQGSIPLFVSHDSRFEGSRMSRVIAWRVVQRAARALGLCSVTPHDFRHWRATQLINAGHSLDVVQEYLGHRSVETTRAYYAHTDPLRVDDAAMSTRLPEAETPPES
jgi:integrase